MKNTASLTPGTPFTDLDKEAINAIRFLAIDAVQKANSGHPGLPMGAAPMAYVLWKRHLKHSPSEPLWMDRDRFVLSPGHGSMLLYTLLYMFGYDVSLDDLKSFRQWGSKTPGHPEYGVTPGVEATTGPLGQGAANAVGMAVAERKLANLFNGSAANTTPIDHYTYAIVSDGDLMEGISAEAASFAGHQKLGKLICMYDSNDITLDGPTDLTFSTENVAMRYESYGWHVITVKDGDQDLKAIDDAIIAAKKESTKPSMIIVKTTIGYGSPNKAGKSSSHGSPLGPDEIKATRAAMAWKFGDFETSEEVLGSFREAVPYGQQLKKNWDREFISWNEQQPGKAKLWKQVFNGKSYFLPEEDLPQFTVGQDFATRESSGKLIQYYASKLPHLLGGDADLSGSTNTFIKDGGYFEGTTGSGRNVAYGVREHAMAAIANGISYHDGSLGGIRPFTATFFCFSDYMRPGVRLAAMNHLPQIYVWTHDSIGLGEDGPTHQPVEHLASLRAIPNLRTFRPGDANEVSYAWKYAIENLGGPTALVLSRQKVPTFDRTNEGMGKASGVLKGGYVLSKEMAALRVVLMATGSEVAIAMGAKERLEGQGVGCRVVSMPCTEIFSEQSQSYQADVLPRDPALVRASLEAASTFGWERFTSFGPRDLRIGVDKFGASAPATVLYKKYGIDEDSVVQKITTALGKA